MAKFVKGQSGNPGGRPSGPTVRTLDFRATVTSLLEGNAQNVSQWLSEVAMGNKVKGVKADPARALDLMAKLAEFAAPKLSRVEHTGDPLQPVQTVHRIELVPLCGNSPNSDT